MYQKFGLPHILCLHLFLLFSIFPEFSSAFSGIYDFHSINPPKVFFTAPDSCNKQNPVLEIPILTDGNQKFSHPCQLSDTVQPKKIAHPEYNSKISPWIASASLISAGSILHFMPEVKQSYRDFIRKNLPYSGHIDDYTPYIPLVITYGLNFTGIKGKNNFGNLTAIAAKSFLLNGLITDRLKYLTQVQRPNGEPRAFPSGHTSKAFALAHVMHREFGETSPWYSAGAYACATATAILRTSKDAHWISDVLAGAGIGILSTELIYRTHQYKWDKEHLKRLDIFPFRLGNQKGIGLVYRF